MMDPEISLAIVNVLALLIFLNISPSLRHIFLEYSFYYSYGRVTGRKQIDVI